MSRLILRAGVLLVGVAWMVLAGGPPAAVMAQTLGPWTRRGPEGANVLALTVDPHAPDSLYAGTPGGLWGSLDGGTSWSQRQAGQPSPNVTSVVMDPVIPRIMYVAAGGVFKSTNGGLSWFPSSTGLPRSYDVTTLAVDPQNSTVLYAGTRYSGLYRSTDGGASWSRTGLKEGVGAINVVQLNPGRPTTVYAALERGGLLASPSSGVAWSRSDAGLRGRDVLALAVDPADPFIVYAGSAGGGVFKSTNGGRDWHLAGLPNLYVLALAVDPANPDTVYAGTSARGVFVSTDRGQTWQSHVAGLPESRVSVLAAERRLLGNLYAGTPNGVFSSRRERTGQAAAPPPPVPAASGPGPAAGPGGRGALAQASGTPAPPSDADLVQQATQAFAVAPAVLLMLADLLIDRLDLFDPRASDVVREAASLTAVATVGGFFDTLPALKARKAELLGAGKDSTTVRNELRAMVATAMQKSAAALEDAARQRQGRARLAADEGTVAALRSALAIYYGRNEGRFPANVEELVRAYGRPLRFECPGNDIVYDAGTGLVRLLIEDPAGCAAK